ncbi:MAG: hypothetical protein Q8O84_01340 [Nanoarchaeota archaeon]|nr:hypothetical protein [Nanoarchaeota archaeon]
MTKTLEQKTGKINRKQWIPIYGIYRAFKDFDKGKPNVLEKPASLCLNSAYQAVSAFPILVGLYELAEKIF